MFFVFTLNFFLQVRSGYLQVDNCIMEDGMVYVQNPGSIAMRFCTFRHATIILQHVNASIIQNCEFSQTDSAAITVEGYPKEDKNWTYRGLNSKIMKLCSLQKKQDRQKHGEMLMPKSAFSLSTATTSNQKSKARYQRQISGDTEPDHRKMSHDFDLQSHDQDGHMIQGSNVPHLGEFRGASIHRRQSQTESNFSLYSRNDGSDFEDGETLSDRHSGTQKHKLSGMGGSDKQNASAANSSENGKNTKHDIKRHKEKIKRIENFVTDCARYSNAGTSGESTIGENDDAHHFESDFTDIHCKGNSFTNGGTTQSVLKIEKQSDKSDDSGSDDDDENDANGNNASIPPLDLHSLASHSNQQGNHSNKMEGAVKGAGERQRVHRSLSSSEVSLHTASSNDVTTDDEAGGAYSSGIVFFITDIYIDITCIFIAYKLLLSKLKRMLVNQSCDESNSLFLSFLGQAR